VNGQCLLASIRCPKVERVVRAVENGRGGALWKS
jgi:hypothetical protein